MIEQTTNTINVGEELVLGSFTDNRDGQTYQTVEIANHTWFSENLNFEMSGTYIYENESSNGDIYGRLYSWEGAKEACPEGWHLPDDNEWRNLRDLLGGAYQVGGKLKEMGFAHWAEPNKEASNIAGFNGLPGGYRSSYGTFLYINERALFWSSTSTNDDHLASMKTLFYDEGKWLDTESNKSNTFSVRCVKD